MLAVSVNGTASILLYMGGLLLLLLDHELLNCKKELCMIVNVICHKVNIKSKVVHAMVHRSTSLCGIHTGFQNRNTQLNETHMKVTCKRCLSYIEDAFKQWNSIQNPRPRMIESFDEEIHSSQIIFDLY